MTLSALPLFVTAINIISTTVEREKQEIITTGAT